MAIDGGIWVAAGGQDSPCIDAVETLMAGGQADMLLTDPPYNVAYQGGTVDKLTIKNDACAMTHSASFCRTHLLRRPLS